MLPKALRLRGREDFEAVFRFGKSIFGPEVSLFFLTTPLTHPRIGFSFKQKVFSRAVTRHFLKRKGSAIMRESLPLLPEGMDIVVLFHRLFSRPVEYPFLKKELEILIKKLK